MITSISSSSIKATRFYWLDWMKVIGIGLIVYGHFFSIYAIYVYVFSVPLFFIISGFLCKKEIDKNIFWRKLIYNLVLPIIIICSINYLIDIMIGYFMLHKNPESPVSFYLKLLFGIHSSIGGLWFVYTLVILKIINQFIPKTYLNIVLSIFFLIAAYIINNFDFNIGERNLFKIPCAISNVFVSYPFFVIGNLLKTWKDRISNYKVNMHTFYYIILCLLIVFICGYEHKYVFLYKCGYGDNLLLFLLGGLVGSILVFLLSKIFENIRHKYIIDISIGTTIILGFHGYFISFFRYLAKTESIADLLFTIIIVVIFIPVIRLCEAHMPILIGKYRINSNEP